MSTPNLPDESSGYHRSGPSSPTTATPNPGMPSPPYGYPGYPSYPYGYPGYPGQPTPYSGYPAPSYNVDPAAPYGRDVATGEPLSNKSAVAGGLLQIFFGMFGVGRFYIGSNTIAIVQLVSTLVSLMLTVVIIGVFILPYIALWTFVVAS